MNTKIRQILYDMRTQPVIAWVTVIGTALSIFLIMTIFMMQQVTIISFKPETHRDRMLYGKNMHTFNNDTQVGSSSFINYNTARRIYGDLEGVEKTSYLSDGYTTVDAMGTTNRQFAVDRRGVDEVFWEIYDYDLLEGRYLNADEVEAERKVAIVTESVARKLFGGESAVGQHFHLSHIDYEIVGVVSDASKLASMAYGEVFTPVSHQSWGGFSGHVMAALLVREGVDFESIRDQVKGRYAQLDTELKESNEYTIYHEQPYDQADVAAGIPGSNMTPDTDSARLTRIIVFILLLIVPAINLSSMLHSRLRRRVSEIGIRRAFGCTRAHIIRDIIAENMIVTVIGGLIGFAFSVGFALFYDGLYSNSLGDAARPALSLLLDWRILLFAFGACFILNILSALLPAWQAARLSPVNAINSK